MSRYLIRRIEQSPAIVLRLRTEIVALEGDGHLERVRWRDNQTGNIETRNIGDVFVMAGAIPSTHWLDGCVALDAKGFIKTGPDLSQDDLAMTHWPLARAPRLLETSLPGVFAVGDVRGGSLKRVASAVGEGSIAVAFVHQALREWRGDMELRFVHGEEELEAGPAFPDALLAGLTLAFAVDFDAGRVYNQAQCQLPVAVAVLFCSTLFQSGGSTPCRWWTKKSCSSR